MNLNYLGMTALLSLLTSVQLTAATGDAVSTDTIASFGMGVSVFAFAIGVIALGMVLRKRGRRRRLNGLSHLF